MFYFCLFRRTVLYFSWVYVYVVFVQNFYPYVIPLQTFNTVFPLRLNFKPSPNFSVCYVVPCTCIKFLTGVLFQLVNCTICILNIDNNDLNLKLSFTFDNFFSHILSKHTFSYNTRLASKSTYYIDKVRANIMANLIYTSLVLLFRII